MDLKVLTSSDAEWIHAIAEPVYADLKQEEVAKTVVEENAIVLGDESIPVYLRILYYKIDPVTAKALPQDIVEGYCTQITDLITPSQDFESVIIPILATGLAQSLKKFPESAQLPVWAYLEENQVAFLQQNYFPGAWIQGPYIGHKTLQAAYDEVKKYGN